MEGQKKKLFFVSRWFFAHDVHLIIEVCNVSLENVLVALEHAQRSVLDLTQGLLLSLCHTGAKA